MIYYIIDIRYPYGYKMITKLPGTPHKEEAIKGNKFSIASFFDSNGQRCFQFIIFLLVKNVG